MKRHATDVVSLIFGVLFVGVAVWWFIAFYLGLRLRWNVPDAGWLLAGGLILMGLLGVVASLRRDREPPAATAATAAPTANEGRDRADATPGPIDEPSSPPPAEPASKAPTSDAPDGDRSDEPERGVG